VPPHLPGIAHLDHTTWRFRQRAASLSCGLVRLGGDRPVWTHTDRLPLPRRRL